MVQSEQLGPRRYIATLGVIFDRARAGGLLGGGGQRARSAPMLTLPVMILAWLAVRLSSRGPAVYSQTRTGLGGRPFKVLKFRSMYVDAEARTGAVWATRDDPRISTGNFGPMPVMTGIGSGVTVIPEHPAPNISASAAPYRGASRSCAFTARVISVVVGRSA